MPQPSIFSEISKRDRAKITHDDKPYAIEAEQAVLGGLMLNNGAWVSVADLLVAEDFYYDEHRVIFGILSSQLNSNKSCDILSVADLVKPHPKLGTDEGISYLHILQSQTPSASNVLAYAEIVKKSSYLRSLLDMGGHITQAVAQRGEHTSINEILEKVEKQLVSIRERSQRGKASFSNINDVLATTVERIDVLYHLQTPITGTPTGFIDFDDYTSGLQPSNLIIVAGRPSMGKCLSSNAEIVLADGSISTIKAICQQQSAQLLTLAQHHTFEFTQPSAYIHDGMKLVFGVTTKLGKYIEATATHPFLTQHGWRSLAELAEGEPIAIPRHLPVFGTTCLAECEIKLLGYLIGNRFNYLSNSLFVSDNPLVQQEFVGVVDEFADGIKTRDDSLSIRLKNLGLCDNRHHTAIPEIIFTLQREQLALFLNRVFAARGFITLLANNKIIIGYQNESKQLVQQLQHLLLRFGILAAIQKDRETQAATMCWQLEIRDAESIHLFIETISIFSKEALLLKSRPFYQQWHQHHLQQNDNNALYWDDIVTIHTIGFKPVYDLTIPDTHNFVANDICVHNTSFAMNIAEFIAIQQKLPVAVFSMEMSSEELAMRLISTTSQVPLQNVRSGRLNDEDWRRISNVLTLLGDTRLFVDDTPSLSPAEVLARARRLSIEQGQLGLIVIDYLQLMQIPNSKENRTTEVSEISRSLKGLSKELKVPVIALSQLNRGLEQRPDKRPRMSDLRESGSIEQDADIIAFIYRDEVYHPDSPHKGTAEVLLAKQRNGPTGVVRLTFLGEITAFENYTGDLPSTGESFA
jgi:replicative DNA helicase